MGGRNAMPVALQVLQGNPNRLTKEDIEFRQDAQIELGNDVFKCPDYIRKNKIANKKWKEIVKLYRCNGTQIASSADVGIISRYCLAHSEYVTMVKMREEFYKELDYMEYSIKKRFELLKDSQIEQQINKKSELLLKMENNLFLTPLAKIKNIPKKPPESEQESMLGKLGFADV